jgi:hypothetical protein
METYYHAYSVLALSLDFFVKVEEMELRGLSEKHCYFRSISF